MSKLVCQMKKVHKKAVRGYQIHNQRELESKTNPDIDPSLEHLNKDFINNGPVNFMEKWQGAIDKGYTSTRKIRDDAVYYNEFIIGSDRDFFSKLDQSEKDRFFQTATDFFKERYGEQNVLYSIAHYDETRGAGAHAHVAIVPLRDGKLQGKNVFDRIELRQLQEELPKALQRAGFDINRGREGSKAKHIDAATFKMMKSQEAEQLAKQDLEYTKQHVDLLNEQIDSKTAALEKIEEIESVDYQQKRTWYGKKTGQVVVDQEDFVQLKQLAEDHAALKMNLDYINQENRVLQRKYEELEKVKNQYADQSHRIGVELHRHKTDIERVISEKMSLEREKNTSKIQALEKENRFFSQELEVTKHHVIWLEGEVSDREKEISELKDRILALKETIKKMKDFVQETTRKLVLEAVGYARKSVYQATQEWLRENARDKVVPFLNDKNQIEKRANGIYADFVVEADRKGKSKDNEFER